MGSRDCWPRGPRGGVLATSGWVGPVVYLLVRPHLNDAPETNHCCLPTNHLGPVSAILDSSSPWLRPSHMLATHLARRAATCARVRPPTQRTRALSSTPPARPPPDHHDAIGLPPPPHVEELRDAEPEVVEAPEVHDEQPSVVDDRPSQRSHPRRPIDFFPDIEEPDAATMAVARVPLPNPNPGSSSVPRKRHPFNTYTFVTVLEKASVPEETAKTLMVGTRQLLNQRSERATSNTLSKEELENVSRKKWLS